MNKKIQENNINAYNNFSLNTNTKKINEDDYIKKIYFGTLFPTQQITKNIFYKNDDKKKIICFQISENKNNKYSEYFKIIIDNNKNYFNLKSNEEINIKVMLQIPFIKIKKQINCELHIIDINNNFIGTFYLYANVEIPKLCCLRYKNTLKESHIPLIKINMKFEESQKFMIPFKNLSTKDIFIDFCLLSHPKKENNYLDYEIIIDSVNNFVIPSSDINYLKLSINIKNIKDFDIKNNNNYFIIKEVIQAKIVGTKISYYFCVLLILTENENNVN